MDRMLKIRWGSAGKARPRSAGVSKRGSHTGRCLFAENGVQAIEPSISAVASAGILDAVDAFRMLKGQ